MDAIRSFIAIETSADVRGRAAGLLKKLAAAEADVKWVAPDNMHLTLKFLGDVPSVETPNICQTVAEVAAEFAPFEFVVKGVGAFPRMDRPRTLWIGIERGARQLEELQAAIDKALLDLRFPREGRRFHPHLTIGRVRSGGPATRELVRLCEQFVDYNGGSTIADEVTLFASFLDRTGPTYRPMGHAELRGP